MALVKQESQIRCELNARNKAAGQRLNLLEAEVKRLKHLLVENAKYNENEIAQSGQTIPTQAPAEEADTTEITIKPSSLPGSDYARSKAADSTKEAAEECQHIWINDPFGAQCKICKAQKDTY